MKKINFDRADSKYRLSKDSRLLGTISLMLLVTLFIFSFIKLPFISAIHGYTIGMIFGDYSPIIYLVFIYLSLCKSLGVKNPLSNYFHLSTYGTIFIIASFELSLVVFTEYFKLNDIFAIGTKPWHSIDSWWDHFAYNNNNIIDPWYPNSYLAGFSGAFLYSFFASFVSSLGALIISIFSLISSLSFLIFNRPFRIYLYLFSKKNRVRTIFLARNNREEKDALDLKRIDAQFTQKSLEMPIDVISDEQGSHISISVSKSIENVPSLEDSDLKKLINEKVASNVIRTSTTEILPQHLAQKELVQDYLVVDKDNENSIVINENIEPNLEHEFIPESELIDSNEIHNEDLPFDVPNIVDQSLKKHRNFYIKPSILEETSIDEKIVENAREEIQQKSKILNKIFNEFKIDASVVDAIVGPVLTKYIIKPGPSVNLKKFWMIEDNIKMALAAISVRMELPIPGQSFIGIECPNSQKRDVSFKEVFEIIGAEEYKSYKLPAALGILIDGKPLIIDIAKTPHFLIAGATGSGKSVGINSIIISLMMSLLPSEVSFILIDPKMVEFTPYHNTKHLYQPIVTDAQLAANALNDVVELMEERYRKMANFKIRNFDEWNKNVSQHKNKKWPYLVIVIDELADLMNVARKDVEVSIQRITQKARAAGIHLIVATQRPSVDVLTGIIKANIPSRMSYAVTSSVDSKVILDATGAELLLGQGDLLIQLYGKHIQRAQGAFLSNNEIEKIAKLCIGNGPYFHVPNKRNNIVEQNN